MTNEQALRLEYPFTPDEIEWRVLRTTKDKTKGQVAAYVDSRAIQYRLDGVLGRENWKNEFVTVQGANNDATSHICTLSIYYPERKEWISKSDGASSTDIEPVKGGLSNAFKRAASMWGIGRYLYGLKNIWANLDEYKAIDKSEYDRLSDLYVKFVKRYLAEQKKKSEPQSPQKPPAAKQTPTQAPANTKSPAEQPPQETAGPSPAPTTKPVPAGGRFAAVPAQPQKAQPQQNNQPELFQIIDTRLTKGGNGTSTLITFRDRTGAKTSGYVKGEVTLYPGTLIHSPKIITKESPLTGKYNIIESYEIAA